jgi:diguanylate cyclase (GGDEF)-like protein/PAS domain S-box-containing protein
MKNTKWILLLRKKSLKWKIIFLAMLVFGLSLIAGFAYFTYKSYWLNVDTTLKGMMNFTDARQQDVIRYLGQNEKLATQLANLADHANVNILRNQFQHVVATDVFRPDQSSFRDEIVAGTQPILTVYHAIDYVKKGVIVVSSDKRREGGRWNKFPGPNHGYPDPYYDENIPVMTFAARTRSGAVYVHADARMLSNIVNGEIGSQAGKVGKKVGVGKTLDSYIVNRQNKMVTESKVRPGQFLKGNGSELPWRISTQQAGVVCGRGGVYTTNARRTAGCLETMGFYIGPSGEKMLGASMPFPDSGWTLVVEQEANELLMPMWVMFASASAALLLISVLACFLFSNLLEKILFRPLKRLQNAIEDVEKTADFSKLIETESEGEIGELGNSYNHMLENLRVLYGSLEGRIEARTRELTNINEQLRVTAAAFETHEGIMITNADNNIIRVNQAFQSITGFTANEVLGKNPRMLSSGCHSKGFYEDMWRQLLGIGTWTGEILDRRKNGEVYPHWMTITAVRDDAGKTTEYVCIFSDITARKSAEDEIRKLAFSDPLTKLPNRRLLKDRLRSALSVSVRSNHYGAVMFLDMDKFKMLNDTLGHDFGDLLLVEVAMRIKSCLRDVDTVARLGGDEFVVIIEELGESIEDASNKVSLIAEKIRISLCSPYQLKDNEHHCSSSIGVSLFHGHEQSATVLLKQADLAMYQAKDSGRNAVRFYDPTMQQSVEARASLEADLRRALPEQQLQLHYQIQVDNVRRVLGAEALLRWIHPVRGIVSPSQFIPIAEESSLILDMGAWVLETACKQLSVWAQSDKTSSLILAVNVSAHQFKQRDFVEQVGGLLKMHRVDSSRLKIELTESVVLNNVAEVISKMHALRGIGVCLSLDDFGTGYSSLSYLKQLPLDQIKIDQGFVRDIVTEPKDAMMVKTIIDMAQNFSLNVIAEGVETEDQLELLKQYGCMAYQGYFFGKPVPIDEFEALLD